MSSLNAAEFINERRDMVHYGVLGMKWGRRRTPEQLGRARKSEDRTAVDAIRKKSRASLSNQELKRTNERLQLERQFSQLTGERTAGSRAQAFIKSFIGVGTTLTALYALATHPATKASYKAAREFIEKYR